MSHSRRPTTYRPSAARASAPHSTSSPTSRCAVGSGRPARSASSVRVSRRCLLVEGAEQRERPAGDAGARGGGVAGHRPALFHSAEVALGLAPAAAPTVRRDRARQPWSPRPRSATRSPAIGKAYAAAGPRRATETQPRLDYPPYRSSILRHPTKDLHHADPEGVELWAPVFGHQDVDAARGRPDDPARRRADRRADGRHRPRGRRRRPAGPPPARGDLAGQRRRPLHPQARPAPGRDRPELHRRRPLPDRRRRRLPVHDDQARALPVEEPPQRLAAGAHPLLAVRHRVHPADGHPDVLPGRPAVRPRPDLPGASSTRPRASGWSRRTTTTSPSTSGAPATAGTSC